MEKSSAHTRHHPLPLCSNCGKKPVLVKKDMLCSGCYWRNHRHGSPDYIRLPKGSTALERFEFYVIRDPAPGGCWLWCGATTSNKANRNYGVIWNGQRQELAHRWSYKHFREPIPDGLVLDHVVCEEPPCVNPWHVAPVTQAVNVQRGKSPSAQHRRKATCPKCGRPYSARKSGKRFCRDCYNAGVRDWTRRTGRVTGEGRGARQRERTHCPKGHEYTPENTYIAATTGHRDCKICRRERKRKKT